MKPPRPIEYYQHISPPTDNAIKFGRKSMIFFQFSNFTKSKVILVDDIKVRYNDVEGYYQAQKSLEKSMREQFTSLTPRQSRDLGQTIPVRPDWQTYKYEAMYDALLQKFLDPEFMKVLMSTGDLEIIEWTSWSDKIWGMCDKDNCGANALGKLLMDIRDANKPDSEIRGTDKLFR